MRRVPIPLVVVCCLVTVGGVWWSETRDMDFMTPRGTEVPLADFAPGLQTPDAPGPRAVVPVNLDANNANGGTGTRVREFTLDLGDLDSSPGLSEYTEHANKGAPYLIALATELESRGEFQRALLCWERILDSTIPNESERQTAASAVTRIKPTLPRWNVDPMAELVLSLQIGSTRSESAAMAGAILELQEFLRKDSGDQLKFLSETTFASDNDGPQDGPIAVSISADPPKSDAASLVRSTAPADNAPTTLYLALLSECYLMISSHLGTLDEVVAPGPRLFPDNPQQDFAQQVTRLHWKVFAQSLAMPRLGDRPYPEGTSN